MTERMEYSETEERNRVTNESRKTATERNEPTTTLGTRHLSQRRDRYPDLTYVSAPASRGLSQRKAQLYDDFMGDFEEWLGTVGKDTVSKKPMSESSIKPLMNRVDKYFRWLWQMLDRFTIQLKTQYADRFAKSLKQNRIVKSDGESYAGSSKRKIIQAVQKLFEFAAGRQRCEAWTCEYSFDTEATNHADPFTLEERDKLRDASLDYDALPAYSDATPEQRDSTYAYLAQKLGKPKSELSPEDWKKHNESWEIPSLIYVALDGGLRPIEIKCAKVDWYQPGSGTLHIPEADAAKNRDEHTVVLGDRTVKIIRQWIDQREHDERYRDSDRIWLNQRQNPHNSGTLNTLLRNLIDEANIDDQNRNLVWYSIRHSTGTYAVHFGGREQGSEILRHKSPQSISHYSHPTIEAQRETVNRM